MVVYSYIWDFLVFSFTICSFVVKFVYIFKGHVLMIYISYFFFIIQTDYSEKKILYTRFTFTC